MSAGMQALDAAAGAVNALVNADGVSIVDRIALTRRLQVHVEGGLERLMAARRSYSATKNSPGSDD